MGAIKVIHRIVGLVCGKFAGGVKFNVTHQGYYYSINASSDSKSQDSIGGGYLN